MGIVVVFLSGLIKLWSSNRQMRKLELLDAEKQARATQMRKSGLSPNGRYKLGSEIPFGVKALESGVEVDGIWTARMASMASQPPNRKWSSRRKPRVRTNSFVEMGDAGSSNKRMTMGSRGSRRAPKISRREIVEPSHETREKLEKMAALEETGEVMSKDQAKASQSNQKGPLGKIQRSLRKVASGELWQDQERKRNAGRVEAREFHEKARAKKPQRFYPESSTISGISSPLVAPKARSHAAQNRLDTLLTTHGASQAVGKSAGRYVADGQPAPTARTSQRHQKEFQKNDNRSVAAHRSQMHNPRQPGSSGSSADSFVTSAEMVSEKPSAPVRVPGPHARRSSEDRRTVNESPVIPLRRSSRDSEHRLARPSIEARRSEERAGEAAQAMQTPISSVTRYPPNSSRSAPVVHQRSQSSSSRHSKPQSQTGSTPTGLRSSSGEM